MNLEVSLGQIVKERRLELGLTQAELARRVGCAVVTLRKIEADSLRPSVQMAELFALALNIPEDEQLAFVRLARAQKPPSPIPTPSPTRAEIGQEDLSGRAVKGFQLGERIGSGGFGVVYRVEQVSVERDVAVKIILPKFADQPEFIRRFEAEAQTVARLEHPHIVPLYDFWREPAAAYLIMRLLLGGSLEDRLQARPLSLAEFRLYFQQLGLALDVAHRSGVVHRDIKLANILLDQDQNAYLADFGIAKQLNGANGHDDQEGTLIGSPAYLSPEQIRSEPIKSQTDIYSLGLLIYEMLTGVKPFQGPTPIAYLQQHLNEMPPSILEYNPDLPPEIDLLLARAMAKDPALRFDSVMEMLSEMDRILLPLAVEGMQVELSPALQDMTTQAMAEVENPYKGLRAFTEADSDDFFGRDTLVQELLAQMAEENDLSRFLSVVGPSGSGKSSAIKAGLVPTLRAGALPGSENWFITDFIPGSQPWQELEEALLRVAINPPDDLQEVLQVGNRGLVRVVRAVLPDDGQTELVLVVDQFEELFTQVSDEEVRSGFLESLVEAVLDPQSMLRVVTTLRADFTDRPLGYVDFGDIMRQRTVFTLPLTPEELEEAIVRPAEGLASPWNRVWRPLMLGTLATNPAHCRCCNMP